jgi:lysine decarboxylase
MYYMNTPIYNTIKKYLNLNPVPFHTPGHKLGKGIPRDILSYLPFLDITELPGTDNLHYPTGILKKAQILASEAFGSEHTFFLVNGSTSGIHAMIMTICKVGDELIVTRDCHKSVIAGMMLAGVKPVYLKPEFNWEYGITTIITPYEVERALINNPKAVGILITRPNYYGVCSDIEEIAKIVHKYGKILAVDEAHGAHLKFGEGLPVCAMDSGADICVQSAHKTLPALTQGSYLHVKSEKIDLEKLRMILSMLQTSSPSYIIMAMLDVARDIMDRHGKVLFPELLEHIERLRHHTEKGNFPWLSRSDIPDGDKDPTRIVINVGKLGLTGYEASKILREKYNIFVEMSDMGNIVFIITLADKEDSFYSLHKGLSGLFNHQIKNKIFPRLPAKDINIPIQAMDLTDVFQAKGEKTSLDKAEGRISKDIITPYPPGIPLICPGELITRDIIEYTYELILNGGCVNGVDEKLNVLVVKDNVV